MLLTQLNGGQDQTQCRIELLRHALQHKHNAETALAPRPWLNAALLFSMILTGVTHYHNIFISRPVSTGVNHSMSTTSKAAEPRVPSWTSRRKGHGQAKKLSDHYGRGYAAACNPEKRSRPRLSVLVLVGGSTNKLWAQTMGRKCSSYSMSPQRFRSRGVKW